MAATGLAKPGGSQRALLPEDRVAPVVPTIGTQRAANAVRAFESVQMPQNEIDLRSSKDVARLLGVTVECLIIWRRAGKGPIFAKIGTRKVAYDMRDVNAWLDTQKQRPTGAERAVA
jgi:hypothetical protein